MDRIHGAEEDTFINWNDSDQHIAQSPPTLSSDSSSPPLIRQPHSKLPTTSQWNDDFQVSINEYKKLSNNYETFIVFDVSTKSKRGPIGPQEYHVTRRFNDFIWLRSRLENEFPMAILPPLPDKHPLTQLERFAGSFIDQRRAALEQFLKRLARHPLTSFSESFVAFLTSDKEIFSRYQTENTVSGNILSRLVSNLSTSVTPLSTYPLEDVTINDQFYQIFKETESMHRVMSRMESVCENMGSERAQFQKDIRELLTCLSSWASQECTAEESMPETTQEKERQHSIASEPRRTSFSFSGSTSSSVMSLSIAWEKVNSSIDQVITVDRFNLAPLFREYALFASVIGQALRKRCDIQQQLNLTRQQLMKVREQLKQLNVGEENHSYHESDDVSPSHEVTRRTSLSNSANSFSKSVTNLWKKKQTPEEMQETLKQRVEQLSATENELQTRLDVYSEEFLTDYARWRSEKRRDIGNALKLLADAQVAHFTASMEAWNQALQSISNDKTVTSSSTASAWSNINVGRPSEGGTSWHSSLNPVSSESF